ncbi:O-antigen ligase family protein [Amnibacterium flavum]|uniref:O-antigen ligase-related domain-containing protein n=1 Tax=Amnibacterium flavum TaxID=2173173 RepID=A0A2V1HX94_9MICO|nr:O-antigen ligase family protein [Amnibacterium flavum]PVZ95909.1 hypothetical protein DDQ50_05435 [Amnibacterium flavum]
MTATLNEPDLASTVTRKDRRIIDRRERDRSVVWGIVGAAVLAAVCLTASITLPGAPVGAILVVFSLAYIFRGVLFSWQGLLNIFLLVVLFIPAKRVAIAIPLPFDLEVYRVVLVGLILAVVVSLLVDPKFRMREMKFQWLIGLMLGTMILSLGANAAPLTEQALAGGSIGAILNFVLLSSPFFLVRLLLSSVKVVDGVIALLSVGGAIIGIGAAIERLTHTNIFLLIGSIPGFQRLTEASEDFRSGGARAFGSAQHPIALGVLLCMLIPLAIYQARHAEWPQKNKKLFWIVCAALMGVGVICTVSRTAYLVLALMALIAIIWRPGFLYKLVIIGAPMAALASLAAPQAVLSSLRSFLDPKSLIESQYASAGWTGSGRLADLGPSLTEAARTPWFGTGPGSRIVTGPEANAFILDNQMLGTLLEGGIVGSIAAILLLVVPTITLLVFARRQVAGSKYRDLGLALAASIAGYFLSLFFFDGFGFLQTLMMFFVLLALGAWLLTESPTAVADRALADRRKFMREIARRENAGARVGS